MGRFLNPGNSAFLVALNSKIYVDKTNLLDITNDVIDTDDAFICNSRPRRFGKSITANMLSAYYSKGCDSAAMFEKLDIGKKPSFRKHLNKYNVIHFDVQWCMMDAKSAEQTVSYINRHLLDELRAEYPSIIPDNTETAYGAMSCINAACGDKFIVIIDEWDVLIREASSNLKVQDEYINFLRGMFKVTEPTKYIHLAYLTGILPIKKLKTQSALNNFEEYTMLDAGSFAPYIGFTDNEVQSLCKCYNIDYTSVKRWYDGYLLSDYHVYNPKAVVSVMKRREFTSYWSDTGTYEAIKPLINMDFDGLRTAIITMMSGDGIVINTKSFQNDMSTFKNKDDVITALIHLGYLAYHSRTRMAFIPNEEIRSEFASVLEESKWSEFIEYQKASKELLEATLDMDGGTVAEYIEKIHSEYVSTIEYNDENSLSSVLTIAYLSSMEYYFKPIRELPSGRGFADFVFIPKPMYSTTYPALLVELKWNHNAYTAINQIKEKKYPSAIKSYTDNILLVGISYDKKTKTHSCIIEK